MLGHGRYLENHNITQIYATMITQILNWMNGARTLKIHQHGAAPGLQCPTSTTGGQPLIARCTMGHKRPTTEYNNNKSSHMTLKVMQLNAEGLMKKKTKLEHRMNKQNIDIERCSLSGLLSDIENNPGPTTTHKYAVGSRYR